MDLFGKRCGYCLYPWAYCQSWLISLELPIPTHSVVSMQMGVTWIGFSLEVVYVKAVWSPLISSSLLWTGYLIVPIIVLFWV